MTQQQQQQQDDQSFNLGYPGKLTDKMEYKHCKITRIRKTFKETKEK